MGPRRSQGPGRRHQKAQVPWRREGGASLLVSGQDPPSASGAGARNMDPRSHRLGGAETRDRSSLSSLGMRILRPSSKAPRLDSVRRGAQAEAVRPDAERVFALLPTFRSKAFQLLAIAFHRSLSLTSSMTPAVIPRVGCPPLADDASIGDHPGRVGGFDRMSRPVGSSGRLLDPQRTQGLLSGCRGSGRTRFSSFFLSFFLGAGGRLASSRCATHPSRMHRRQASRLPVFRGDSPGRLWAQTRESAGAARCTEADPRWAEGTHRAEHANTHAVRPGGGTGRSLSPDLPSTPPR